MISTIVLTFALLASCPMHSSDVDHRHDTLGMSHQATHHSFRLLKDGGAIELLANDAKDKTSIDAIRTHLQAVSAQFAKNDFATPMFVHDRMPDGVAEMQRLHEAIEYRYEELPAGGRIRITTRNADALKAVHAFMRFQVKDHRTGDSGEVEK